MKRYCFLLIVLIFFVFECYASGTSNLMMNDIQENLLPSDSPFELLDNPAGIAFSKYPVISFMHHVYLQEMSIDSLNLIYPFRNFTFGAAPTYFRREQMLQDEYGNNNARSFNYSGLILPFAASYLVNNFSIGSTVKYYSEEINDYATSITTIDIGSVLQFNKIRLGVSGLNLTGKLDYYQLPRTFKSGVEFTHGNYVVSTEYDRNLLDETDSICLGSRILIAKMLCVKYNYKFKEDNGGLSGGLELKMDDYAVDYTYLGASDFGIAHRAGISVLFGFKRDNSANK
ncbi:MAG: hypothetical protein JW871_01360 [Endomicrobiales bacterium]|nr:hypothetical protein [Endomicrobiales bacterium]